MDLSYSLVFKKNSKFNNIENYKRIFKINEQKNNYDELKRICTILSEKLFSNKDIDKISDALFHTIYYKSYNEKEDDNILIPKLKKLSSKILEYLKPQKKIDDRFYLIFNEYYTYHQIIINKKQEIFEHIDNIYEHLSELAVSYKIIKNDETRNKIKCDINKSLDDIFSKEPFYSLNIFFNNYLDYINTPVYDYVWSNINNEKLLILIISYLKTFTIDNIDNIKAKKTLYYKIDIDKYCEYDILNKNTSKLIEEYYDIIEDICIEYNILTEKNEKKYKTCSDYVILSKCIFDSLIK